MDNLIHSWYRVKEAFPKVHCKSKDVYLSVGYMAGLTYMEGLFAHFSPMLVLINIVINGFYTGGGARTINTDILFSVLIIIVHLLLSIILYWRKPIDFRNIAKIIIFNSWLAQTLNVIGIVCHAWSFPSPSLGLLGTLLVYNIMAFPLKVLPFIFLLGVSWRFNLVLTLIFSLIPTLLEWLVLTYSTLIVYIHWNIFLTFLSYVLIYGLNWYLFYHKCP